MPSVLPRVVGGRGDVLIGAVTLALLATYLAPGSTEARRGRSSATATPAANERFAGSTSQQRRLAFRVNSRRRIVDFRWTVRMTCGRKRQTHAIELTIPLRVRRGRFSTPRSAVLRISGRFVRPRAARGTLSLTYRSAQGRCRSGTVTFTARA